MNDQILKSILLKFAENLVKYQFNSVYSDYGILESSIVNAQNDVLNKISKDLIDLLNCESIEEIENY